MWRDEAACRTLTPAEADRLFFPIVVFGDLTVYDEGRAYCSNCPVATDCARAGETEPYGLFGGLTPTDRGYDTDLNPDAAEEPDNSPEAVKRRNREAMRVKRSGAL